MISKEIGNTTLQEMLQGFEEYKKDDCWNLFKQGKGYYEIFGEWMAIQLNNFEHALTAYEY